MAYTSSHQSYSNGATNRAVTYSSSGSGGSSATSLYAIKMNPACCGSFSRGQRCRGCPGK